MPETIPNNSEDGSESEPSENPELAPQAAVVPFKKKGKGGRERDYKKVRKVILFKVKMGRYAPDISDDMEGYYNFWYFTKPNKKKDGEDYERHVRAYSRGQEWIAEIEDSGTGTLGSGNITDITAKRRAIRP